ncbi:uncharacterized [Tachysurus ichikawai]
MTGGVACPSASEAFIASVTESSDVGSSRGGSNERQRTGGILGSQRITHCRDVAQIFLYQVRDRVQLLGRRKKGL